MVMVSKLSNFPDELSENDELREFELSGSDCTTEIYTNVQLRIAKSKVTLFLFLYRITKEKHLHRHCLEMMTTTTI